MAFLKGVLESVKDDTNVASYYYITNDKLTNINTFLYTGHNNFSHFISYVNSVLSDYDVALKRKTDHVKTPLIDLYRGISVLGLDWNTEKYKPLKQQFDYWKCNAQEYVSKAYEADKSREKLDVGLNEKIETSTKLIIQAVECFKNSCKNRDLEILSITAGNELEKLRDAVQIDIRDRIEKLETALKGDFATRIEAPIAIVAGELDSVSEFLTKWTKEAERIVEKTIGKCNTILNKLKGTEHRSIRRSAEVLKYTAMRLLNAYNNAHQKVEEFIKIGKTKVKALDEQLRTGLYQAKTEIMRGVTQYVDALLQQVRVHFEVIKAGVGNTSKQIGDRGSIDKHWSDIKEAIGSDVKNIYDEKKRSGHLRDLVTKIGDYSKEFKGEDGFGSKVEGWVRDMFETDGLIKQSIDGYVSKVSGRFTDPGYTRRADGGRSQFEDYIAQFIRTKFEEDITRAGAEVEERIKQAEQKPTHREMLETYFDAVTAGIAKFSTAVEGMVKLNGVFNFAEGIANEMESGLTSGSKLTVLSGVTADISLTNAVQRILLQLIGVGIGTTAELKGFLETSKLSTTLEEAINKTTRIERTIVSTGEQLETFLQRVVESIGDLESALNDEHTAELNGKVGTQLPDKNGTVQIEIAPKLSRYEECIKHVRQSVRNFETVLEAFKPLADGDGNGLVTNTITEIQDLEAAVHMQLEQLYEIVNKPDGAIEQKGIKILLIQLSGMLGKSETDGMKYILKRINIIQTSDVAHLISNANNFLAQTIPRQFRDTIDDIRHRLYHNIQITTTNIQIKAQELYAQNKQTELCALEAIVYAQVEQIITIIDENLNTGVKSLLKTLRGEVENTIMKEIMPDGIFKNEYKNVATLYHPTYRFLSALLKYTHADLKNIDPDAQLEKFSKPLQMPFSILANIGHFTSAFANTISTLSALTSALDPQALPDAGRPVLRALQRGMLGFVGELGKAYISKYSTETFKEALTTTKDEKNTLTEYGRKCAKVCLSIVPIVTDALKELKDGLEDEGWQEYKVYNDSNSNHSLHRRFFTENGYDVGVSIGSKYGELNHHDECNGKRIFEHLMHSSYKLFTSSSTQQRSLPATDDISVEEVEEGGRLSDLYHYLTTYFRVCHLGAPSKRHPCSVNEMLCWLTGLPHNGVYEKLKGHVHSVFMVPKKDNPSEKIYMPIDASPSPITEPSMLEVIEQVCAKSYAMLTTFVGTGDEATYYACEFPNNSLGLQYPSNPADCLDTLLDILRRIFPSLRFLFMQCGQPASENGWLKCEYGKNVASSKWPCKEHSKTKSKCEATCQPTCRPNDQPNCQPTSPLQSYLSDSLTGHLPHSLTSIGCKAECNTCPKGKPGMPCITPLGFRAFSGSTKTGGYLCNIVGAFLDIDNIYSLFALSVKAPKTLPEHFDFVSCLVRGWISSANIVGKYDVQHAFEESAKNLSIQLYDKPNELTDALGDAYGSESAGHRNCQHHHLLHLTSFETCKSNTKHCAPYMLPLCRDAYKCLPFKNSNTYLSWAVYLPWSFWSLLNNLYNAFCSINCQDWGCRGCLRGDKCKKGQHGRSTGSCNCTYIVRCRGVSPTFYKYGLCFFDAAKLNVVHTRRTCFSFQKQLSRVVKSAYFTNLFDECDKFLYYIRLPFMTLTLALWSLSLLYLTHIMVIRLDLLHIKSHLHSPSSHRIAAQSLLAAGRVNKLNRVFYLQP